MRDYRLLTVLVFLVTIVSVSNVKALDGQIPQVLIEARIVEVHQDFSRNLGVDYTFLYSTESGQRTLEVTTLAVGAEADLGKWTPETALLIMDSETIKPESTEIFYVAVESQHRRNLISAPQIVVVVNQDKTRDSVTGASPSKGYPTSYGSQIQKGYETSVYSVDDKGFVSAESIDGATYSQKQAIKGYESPGFTLEDITVGGISSTSRTKGRLQGLKSKFIIPEVPSLSDIPTLNLLFKTEIRDRDKGNLMVVLTPLIIQEKQ